MAEEVVIEKNSHCAATEPMRIRRMRIPARKVPNNENGGERDDPVTNPDDSTDKTPEVPGEAGVNTSGGCSAAYSKGMAPFLAILVFVPVARRSTGRTT